MTVSWLRMTYIDLYDLRQPHLGTASHQRNLVGEQDRLIEVMGHLEDCVLCRSSLPPFPY